MQRKGRKMSSRTATNIAFAVIIVFVVMQVVWWFVFQNRYARQVTQETISAWERDAVTAAELLESGSSGAELLLERFPHLSYTQADGFSVASQAQRTFLAAQRGHLRMFALEGTTFIAVIIATLIFVSSRLRAERELEARQHNFLSAVTHEFKTPLSTLRLLIETALYRDLPAAKLRSYLLKMERELARLEESSDQVLASARLEQASGLPVLQALELNGIMQGVAGKLRAGLEMRGARLEIIYSPEPLPVSLDPQAFELVLNNLLDNAVKYTPAEVKPVTVRLLRDEHLVQVRVEDEGPGVTPAEAGRIFDRFYRVGSEMTRTSRGVGLGLHLVQRTMEAMNGWVRYEPNAQAVTGSCFVLLLPLRVHLSEAEQAELDLPVRSLEGT
jgi:signal transduction histidine kinase